jgi:hypothetical protein
MYQPHINPNGVVDTTTLYPGEEIAALPPEFWRTPEALRWQQLQADWFFDGLVSKTLVPRAQVDQQAAWQHLARVQRGFDLPHEEKVQAVTWLLLEWFESGTWVVRT